MENKYFEMKSTLLSTGIKEEYIEKLKPIMDNATEIIKKTIDGKIITFIAMNKLSKNIKLDLIAMFHEAYFNTNIDIKDFSCEFYSVAASILDNEIPVKLEYLLAECVYEDIVNLLID